MKNIKKLTIICLSLLICLGLSACKSEEQIKKEEESNRAEIIKMINDRLDESRKEKDNTVDEAKNIYKNRERFINNFKKQKLKFKDEGFNEALDRFVKNYEDKNDNIEEDISFNENTFNVNMASSAAWSSHEKEEYKTILENLKKSTINQDESFVELYEKYSIKYYEKDYKRYKEEANRLKNPQTIEFGKAGETRLFKIKPLKAYKYPDYSKNYSDGGWLDDKNVIMLDLEIENISDKDEINIFVSDSCTIDELDAIIQDENGYQLSLNNDVLDDSSNQKILKKGAKTVVRLAIGSKKDFAKRLKLIVNPYWDNITFDIPVN